MSITAITTARNGRVTQVSATSSLSGVVYYFLYLDGAYVGEVRGPGAGVSKTFTLAAGEQARVDVLDSNDPAFDPILNAPAGWPATRTLAFGRSLDPMIGGYRVEQQENGGAWVAIATVADDPKRWEYRVVTPRLEDLASYAWRVIPVSLAGNDGTAVTLGSEKMVRTPDAPGFTVAFDPGTTKVTFAAA